MRNLAQRMLFSAIHFFVALPTLKMPPASVKMLFQSQNKPRHWLVFPCCSIGRPVICNAGCAIIGLGKGSALTRLRWWATALISVPSLPVARTLQKPADTDEEVVGAIGFWILSALAGTVLIIVDLLRAKRRDSPPDEPGEDS